MPGTEVQLPRASGLLHQVVLSRSAHDELVVGIVTLRAGFSTVTLNRIRVEQLGDITSLSVQCDSSLTGAGAQELRNLVPAEDHVVIGVFDDPSEPDHSIVLRRLRVDGSQPASQSPALALPTEPAGLSPMDAVSDGRGGCFIAVGSHAEIPRIIHALPEGRLDPRWPTGGRLFGAGETTVQWPLLAADGEGGAYAAWVRLRGPLSDTSQFVAVRFDSTGHVAPGWDSTGTALVSGGPDFQFRTSIAVGRDGMLFGTFSDIARMFVAALDGHGRPASGWPPGGYPLHPLTFGVDVLGTILTPLANGQCLAVWSVKALETQGYDLLASVLPLPSGAEPWEPGRHTSVCATETDQFVGASDFSAGRSTRLLWTDQFSADPLNGNDGIYVRGVSFGDARPLEPRLALSARVRSGTGARCTWRSMSILDVLPHVFVSRDGQSYVDLGQAQRADSWTVFANVPFGAGCSTLRIQLAVPGQGVLWTSVAEPVVLACVLKGPWTIAAVDASQSDVLEVRLVSEGTSGPVQLSLFDVTGRKLAAVQGSLHAGGESVCQLPAPRRQGLYWVEAKTASYRTTRRTMRMR